MKHSEHLLFIDIETVPVVRHYHQLSERMQRLWDKKACMLNPQCENPDVDFEEKAGIYAEFGKIVCIGLGYFQKTQEGTKFKIKTISGHDEEKILREFRAVCEIFFKQGSKQFCGHNIKEFDIPYLCRRLFIHQIELPQVLMDLQSRKPWDNPMMDTLQFWKFGEYKSFASIELLASILEIDTPKDDISGNEVAKVYWQENDLKRIANYCKKDVVAVAQIFSRLHHMPLIQEEELEECEG